MKVYDKTCIFCFFPISNKYLCMAKRSLLSRCPSYKPTLCLVQSAQSLHYGLHTSGRVKKILGTFEKLRKATIGFALPACLSIRMEKFGFHWTDFHEIWYLRITRKFIEKIKVSLKSDKNNGYLILRPMCVFLIISRSVLLRTRNVLEDWRIVVRKLMDTLLYSITFPASRVLYE